MPKFKLLSIAVALTVWSLFCSFIGGAVGQHAIAQKSTNEIVAEKITIVDKNGEKRIVLNVDPKDDWARVNLFNKQGDRLFTLFARKQSAEMMIGNNLKGGFMMLGSDKRASGLSIFARKSNGFLGLSYSKDGYPRITYGDEVEGEMVFKSASFRKFGSTDFEHFCSGVELRTKGTKSHINLIVGKEGSSVSSVGKDGYSEAELRCSGDKCK